MNTKSNNVVLRPEMQLINTFSIDTAGAARSDDRKSYIVYMLSVNDMEERFIVRRGDWQLILRSSRPEMRLRKNNKRGKYDVIETPDQTDVDKDLVSKIVEGVEGWLIKNGY